MERFKDIVAATDMSSASLGVVSYASHLASAEDSQLTIVHVVPSASLTDYGPLAAGADLDLADSELLEYARSTLESWAHRHLKKIHVDVVVQHGVIDEVICQVARERDADVLVVGSHERHGLDRIAIGSVARRLMREAPCPVLVVKPPDPSATVETNEEEVTSDTKP
jgi:nucleotide-binding universal stress UspA family protein